MGTEGNVSNKWKSAAVGQHTPFWIMHAERKIQQGSAPHPPGGDWPGLKPPRHATVEPVTGATTNVHRSENKHRIHKLQEEQGL